MTGLLAAEDCCILLIDPARRHLRHLSENRQERLKHGFAFLDEIAAQCDVPRVLAQSDETDGNNWYLAHSCGTDTHGAFGFNYGGSPWSNGDLALAVRNVNRPRLFIAGFWLSDSVTFAALNALSEGYSTYLIVDMSEDRQSRLRAPSMNRLVLAGVIPTTSYQIAREWTAETTDLIVKSQLKSIIEGSDPP